MDDALRPMDWQQEHSSPPNDAPRRRGMARPTHDNVSENKSGWAYFTPWKKHNDDGRDDIISQYEDKIAGWEEYTRGKELEWEKRERKLLSIHQQKTSDQDKAISELRDKLLRNESEMHEIREKHSASIRKHQELSFKQMESARWRPSDEGETVNHLDRLKRSMRSLAKDISIKDFSTFASLAETEYSALMQSLEQVALIENNTLPAGIFTAARAPTLLLNALLAHSVYSSFFRSPFFSFKDQDIESSVLGELEDKLDSIYQQAKQANQKDASIWRSDTLRLFMPPLRHDTLATEKQMRNKTEALIARIGDQHALIFLDSPARLLITSGSSTEFESKLLSIFRKAAALSYMLWTQRTEMRCLTLQDLAPLTFDPDCARFTPDSLVRCEGQEEHFRGRMVTVMVHPLLEVYGTGEAEDYDKSRVWAEGIVWFDNREGDAAAMPK